jgi:tetratricopeptide (TPR) repeat protein
MNEAPKRLKHDDELGPLLEAADASLARDRLAGVHVRVRERIAQGSRFAAWKLVLAIALLAGGAAIAWQLLRTEATAVAVPGDAMAADAPPIDAAIDAAIDAQLDAPVDAAEIVAAIDARPAVTARPQPADAGIPDAPPADAAVASDLPEQIRIYEQARDASRRGQFAVALARLDELVARFPATPLAADAALTRADVLARAGKLAEAAAALEALVADPVHRHRRGELLRTLGDVERRRGDCARARDAYKRASAEKLTPAQSRDVAHGLERCAGR